MLTNGLQGMRSQKCQNDLAYTNNADTHTGAGNMALTPNNRKVP